MTWEDIMKEELENGPLRQIRQQLDIAYQTTTVYPAKENLFRALEMTPLDQVKVVILGQDPYHGPGQAQGFSFSVPANMKIPPSLVNIYKELALEYDTPINRSGDLSDWASQGVLLLNAVLSVEAGKPLSHHKMGWQQFTNDLLKVLNEQDQPIVFLLWGAQAKGAKQFLNHPNHLVLESVHPPPLSASRGFFGNNHFKLANQFLIDHGVEPINWIQSNR